jgi:3-hydroxyacyl-CoA dehydrogenase
MRDRRFRIGPFELMDLIGNDVNYAVTRSRSKRCTTIALSRHPATDWKRIPGTEDRPGHYEYGAGAQAPHTDVTGTVILDRILAC